jgi:hypothetical protein
LPRRSTGRVSLAPDLFVDNVELGLRLRDPDSGLQAAMTASVLPIARSPA